MNPVALENIRLIINEKGASITHPIISGVKKKLPIKKDKYNAKVPPLNSKLYLHSLNIENTFTFSNNTFYHEIHASFSFFQFFNNFFFICFINIFIYNI